MARPPKRSLSQNFLVDSRIAARIVDEARIQAGETVLEIGPGRGALTQGLLQRVGEVGGRLVLVELDDDLAAELARRYEGHPRVEVIHRDILLVSISEICPSPRDVRVVGNIPYNLTSPILFQLLDRPRPKEILLMVQREVADRILSDPGSRVFGALTVGVRAVADVERVLDVPAGAFRPRPSVDSTVVRIRPHSPPSLAADEEARLRMFTRAAFQWRRKQLGKIMRDHPDLRLDEEAIETMLQAGRAQRRDRPEVLDPADFVAIARVMPPRVMPPGAVPD